MSRPRPFPRIVASAMIAIAAVCMLALASCQSRQDRAIAIYSHDVALHAAHKQIVEDKVSLDEIRIEVAQDKLRILAVLIIALSAGALVVSFEVPTVSPIAKKAAVVGAGIGIAVLALVPVVGHEGLLLGILILAGAVALAVHYHVWTHFRSVHRMATEIATHIKADYSILSADARKEFDKMLTVLHRSKSGAAKPVNVPTPKP